MHLVSAPTDPLRLALKRIDSDDITENQLSELIRLSRAIIQAHLTFLRSSLTSLCVRQGLTVTDLAYDCIAEAFSRDGDDRFYKLHKFIDSIDGTLDTIPDHGLFLAYKSFLLRFTEAQLARLYSQMDPSGSHIHRNIREALKDSCHFALQKDFRGLCLVPRQGDALEELGPFPQDELGRIFLPAISSRSSIPQMLEILHGIVCNQRDFRRSIPLIELVWLVKGIFQSDFNPELSVDHPWSLDGLSQEELQRIRIDVENALKEKILLTYLVKGKLTDSEARGIFNALEDVLDEWFAGSEPSESLYIKLSRHLQIEPADYEQDYRAKMEYLFRLARQEVASRVLSDL